MQSISKAYQFAIDLMEYVKDVLSFMQLCTSNELSFALGNFHHVQSFQQEDTNNCLLFPQLVYRLSYMYTT